ncbi:MAG: nucleotidyl transferase AbiEii/AbiGii toxin family protein [Deltaproteobacteria bacterium]|nr:nucleotidyl transferase AbiEii/AbiGii toxin family protein [Deltaproteobacteria bacterium]
MALTRALVQRHAGRAAYEAALLDVAQDYLLHLIHAAGLFDRPGLVFKGGTSLRKCRLGSAGRFSTDLDLAAPDDTDVVDVCAAIDGARIAGFSFSLADSSGSARIWSLDVQHDSLGNVTGLARVEFARRKPALTPERLVPIALPIHAQYGVELAALPVIAEVEACAEKLARYRRTPLARDLYDLAWFATRPINERLLRRLWVLKVYCDVVEDDRGGKPLTAADVLTKREVRDFPAASIGVLTQAPDIAGWEARVRTRFQFLSQMDTDEQRWALCNPRDHDEVLKMLANSGFA